MGEVRSELKEPEVNGGARSEWGESEVNEGSQEWKWNICFREVTFCR